MDSAYRVHRLKYAPKDFGNRERPTRNVRRYDLECFTPNIAVRLGKSAMFKNSIVKVMQSKYVPTRSEKLCLRSCCKAIK